MNLKLTGIEPKCLTYTVNDLGKHSNVEIVWVVEGILWTKAEHTLFLWMPMDINKCHTRLSICLNQLLKRVNSRVDLLIRIDVLSIQIMASEWGTIITCNHTIWVEHRDYIHHTTLSDLLSLLCTTEELLDQSLTYIWTWTLSWMHPCWYDHNFLLG